VTRYLITGARGMLGRDLHHEFARRGEARVTALGRAELDITDLRACVTAVTGHDVVLNAAAYTAVERAESDEAAARLVNATGAENLGPACAIAGAVLVHYSTELCLRRHR
jgi:dTDP-4-dehydrorhamnose reductase